MDEGRVMHASGSFSYEYFLKDHLGNTRVAFTPLSMATEYSKITQEDHYYPFGMRMAYLGASSGQENKFLYNGKELEDDLGLNWYHYGARYYDPQVGRWWAVDPLYQGFTPYSYVLNNPIVMNDPTGMWGDDIWGTIRSIFSGIISPIKNLANSKFGQMEEGPDLEQSSKKIRSMPSLSLPSSAGELGQRIGEASSALIPQVPQDGYLNYNYTLVYPAAGKAGPGITFGLILDSNYKFHPYFGTALSTSTGWAVTMSSKPVTPGLSNVWWGFRTPDNLMKQFDIGGAGSFYFGGPQKFEGTLDEVGISQRGFGIGTIYIF